MSEENPQAVKLFGRDISQIPCFRNSFLYGISGGAVVGVLTFLGTSRTKFATHVGFGSFFCGTIAYWFTCRYQWSKKRFQYQQLQSALKQQALYEGTELENELDRRAESA